MVSLVSSGSVSIPTIASSGESLFQPRASALYWALCLPPRRFENSALGECPPFLLGGELLIPAICMLRATTSYSQQLPLEFDIEALGICRYLVSVYSCYQFLMHYLISLAI